MSEKKEAQEYVASLFAPGESGQQMLVVGTVDMSAWPPVKWREGLVRQDVRAFNGMPLVVSTGAAQVPVMWDYPEPASHTDYLHLAGENWDDDYKTIWAKLQAEVETKIRWRKFAKSLYATSITQAELDAKDAWIRELETQVRNLTIQHVPEERQS